MQPVDIAALPANSPLATVARASGTAPEFAFADLPGPMFMAARWHRRHARLDEPTRIDGHLLSYCERGGGLSTIEVAGVARRVRQRTGSVVFLPAGELVRWDFECGAEVAHLHLYIAREALSTATHGAPGQLGQGLTALLDMHDAWLDGFFRLLAAEYQACCARGRPQDFEFLARMGDRLLLRVLELQGPVHPFASTRLHAPLRAGALHAIVEHVESHLADPLPLSRLAALAGMSADHFVRAFAQATGSTPHRWILERRLDAARARLAAEAGPLSPIARECGFASASHLSASFHRRFGVTPSAFRRGAGAGMPAPDPSAPVSG